MDISLKNLVAKLAKKHKLPEHVIERIAAHQFQFVADTMRSGSLEPVRLHQFGVFHVPDYKRAKFKKKHGDDNEGL